jgi:acyl carrier protein phosphodiesterase
MNFLAHIYLSGEENPDLLLGNFMTDFVKGKSQKDVFGIEIQEGFALHYKIDEFTDSHIATKTARLALKENFGRYAGVIIDIFYDHFLSKNFHLYHTSPIEMYAQEKYDFFFKNFHILPSKMQEILPYMKKENWLVRYADFDGLTQCLRGIARRTKHAPDLSLAVSILAEKYAFFEDCFNNFFPDIIKEVKNWREDRNNI